MLERGVEEEVGCMRKGDLLLIFASAFKDAQLNDWGWVNRPSISGGCSMKLVKSLWGIPRNLTLCTGPAGPCSLGLLHHGHLIEEGAAILGVAGRGRYTLVWNVHDACHSTAWSQRLGSRVRINRQYPHCRQKADRMLHSAVYVL